MTPETKPSPLTRASLYYPMAYLLVAGAGLMVAPGMTLHIFFARGDYGPVFPRLAGVLIVGLGIIVMQVVRRSVSELYATLAWVRVFFCACWAALFAWTGDPFFAFLLGVVGFGAALTFVARRVDASRRAP
jgi:hypothetical protein